MLLLEWEGVIGIASVIPFKERPAVLIKTDSPSTLYSMHGYIKFINVFMVNSLLGLNMS